MADQAIRVSILFVIPSERKQKISLIDRRNLRDPIPEIRIRKEKFISCVFCVEFLIPYLEIPHLFRGRDDSIYVSHKKMEKGFVIAIDGPVAAGKSTIAALLAKELGAYYLTTGFFYRAVTLYCLDNKIDIKKEEAVARILPEVQIAVKNERVFLNERDITAQLHVRTIDQSVATIANYTSVRMYLLPLQQQIGVQQIKQGKIVILEGRDIATKVFPHALIKIYLTSDVKVRAQRRFSQIRDRAEHPVKFSEVLQDTRARDEKDMHGSLAYLASNPREYGYMVLDDTNLTEKQTLVKLMKVIEEKKKTDLDKSELTVATYDKIADIYTEQYFEDLSDIPYINTFLSFLPKNSRILDVGCGPGNISKYIMAKGFSSEGIDLSKEMIKIAKSKVPNAVFNVMDMRQLTYVKNTFDGIILAYSLIHIPSEEIQKTLQGFYRILKKKGFILIIAQYGKADQIVDEPLRAGEKIFINFFTKERINSFLKDAGFETVYKKTLLTEDQNALSDKIIYMIAQKV